MVPSGSKNNTAVACILNKRLQKGRKWFRGTHHSCHVQYLQSMVWVDGRQAHDVTLHPPVSSSYSLYFHPYCLLLFLLFFLHIGFNFPASLLCPSSPFSSPFWHPTPCNMGCWCLQEPKLRSVRAYNEMRDLRGAPLFHVFMQYNGTFPAGWRAERIAQLGDQRALASHGAAEYSRH